MKTKFELYFNSNAFRLTEKHEMRFRGDITLSPRESDEELGTQTWVNTLIFIEIEPSNKRNRDVLCSGSIFITLEGDPDRAFPLVELIADYILEHLKFIYIYGDLNIIGGIVHGMRIAENEEEKSIIGDKPHWVHMNLVEDRSYVHPEFDKKALMLLPTAIQNQKIIKQYNNAAKIRTPIEAFLGYFKVLEFLYMGKYDNFEPAFLRNEELRKAAKSVLVWEDADGQKMPLTQEQTTNELKNLIEIRNKCAHLREQYGYSPDDPEVFNVVRPKHDIVKALAKESIKSKYKEAHPDIDINIWEPPEV